MTRHLSWLNKAGCHFNLAHKKFLAFRDLHSFVSGEVLKKSLYMLDPNLFFFFCREWNFLCSLYFIHVQQGA